VELRRDFRTVGILGQREAASESTKGSLDAMEFLLLIFLLAFAFSGNAKDAGLKRFCVTYSISLSGFHVITLSNVFI
jgi:hypothetical protein